MDQQITERPIEVFVSSDLMLQADLRIPPNPQGVVLFVHGSGSSRYSPRNRAVAQALNEGGMATLLLDLLTETEEAIDYNTREYRFDIALLAERVTKAIDWLIVDKDTRSLNIGLFGASTGSAAALLAATQRQSFVSAIVSRGGRPDLVPEALSNVQAATLFIVGANDDPIISLNEKALDQLRVERKGMILVPGATHLFEEPGTLEEVEKLARRWFLAHLPRGI